MMGFIPDDGKIIHGVLIATVSDNDDKEHMGRIKVSFPSLSGEKVEYWAGCAVLMAGKGTGTFFIPDRGEQVLVAFENGNITRPYVIGSLWSANSKTPDVEVGEKNNIRLIKSRSGHTIRMDDTESNEKIEIMDKEGKNLIAFDSANNTITIKSEKDIILDASKGTLKINTKGIEVSGEKIEIIASDGLKLEGKSQTIVKGGKVNIN